MTNDIHISIPAVGLTMAMSMAPLAVQAQSEARQALSPAGEAIAFLPCQRGRALTCDQRLAQCAWARPPP